MSMIYRESCEDDYTTSIIRAKQWQTAVDLLDKVPHPNMFNPNARKKVGGALETHGDFQIP